MAILNYEEASREGHPSLGEIDLERLQRLIDLCTGDNPCPGHDFYILLSSQLVLTVVDGEYKKRPFDPITKLEAEERLDQVYWLESEDLWQDLYIAIIENKIRINTCMSFKIVACQLAKIIIESKTYKEEQIKHTYYRGCNNIERAYEQNFEEHIDSRSPLDSNPYHNWEDISLYDKYLLYLQSLGYNYVHIAKVLEDDYRNFFNHTFFKRKEQAKELKCLIELKQTS